jgi:hypothetical protein
MKIEQKISTAQWTLERQLQWIAQAEVKIGVLVTLDIAMFGGLFAIYSGVEVHTPWAIVMVACAIAGLCCALLCSAMCLLPRLKAPYRSLIFFGGIANMAVTDFLKEAMTNTDEKMLEDLLCQVHRNAEIARDKHAWVRKSQYASFIAALLGVIAVLLLVKIWNC